MKLPKILLVGVSNSLQSILSQSALDRLEGKLEVIGLPDPEAETPPFFTGSCRTSSHLRWL